MKTFSLFILLFSASFAFGHEYFFAFAEFEYNDITRKFEGTLIVSTHDLEKAAEDENYQIGHLKEIQSDSPEFKNLEKLLTSHFTITYGSSICQLSLVGLESQLNGVTNFYFESEEINLETTLEIMFDLLMDQFVEQQNKITLFYRNQSYTKLFINSTHKQQVILDNN